MPQNPGLTGVNFYNTGRERGREGGRDRNISMGM